MSVTPPMRVVLTPVRNEAWVLERFLRVCEQFADAIVILDQNSEDGSRDICRRHPKCLLLENPNEDYNEAHRQRVLIEAARTRWPGQKILLALDADEILSADSLDAKLWEPCYSAKQGTAFFFEKPDILHPTSNCWRQPELFLLGYYDDGAAHVGKTIHSQRLPYRPGGMRLDIPALKVMHFARVRPHEYYHRQCFYSMVERLKGISPMRVRWLIYSQRIDWTGRFPQIKRTPQEWLAGWRQRGIDLNYFESLPVNEWTHRVLKLFERHGSRCFWWEDIWDVDWEAVRQGTQATGLVRAGNKPIERPPLRRRISQSLFIKALALSYTCRAFWSRQVISKVPLVNCKQS